MAKKRKRRWPVVIDDGVFPSTSIVVDCRPGYKTVVLQRGRNPACFTPCKLRHLARVCLDAADEAERKQS